MVTRARRGVHIQITERLRQPLVHVLEHRQMLGDPEIRRQVAQAMAESFRQGPEGNLEIVLTESRPWGFEAEQIAFPRVFLWHGEQDAHAPVAMGRYLASVIPGCQATFYPGEGHLHFIDRLPEISAALCA